jgi:hypothetical protein
MSFLRRDRRPDVPEVEVENDDFTIRQPASGDPEPEPELESSELVRVPQVVERKGKMPPHSWGS